jgi:hypothetical protein
MPTLSKSAAILATAWFALAVVPAIAQEPPGKPAAKKAAPKSGGKVQAKSETKKTEPKVTATAAKAPETAEKPEPAHRPTEGELAHIARYDAAIAPVRDLALAATRRQACARPSRRRPKAIWPMRAAARDKVRIPRHASWSTGTSIAPASAQRAKFAPSRMRPSLARSASADPALRRGAVQQRGERCRDQGILRRQGADHGGRPGGACLRLPR